MEECAFDAYDCSNDQNQKLNTTFVHFVTVHPISEKDAVFDYLHTTYVKEVTYEEGMSVMLSRVIVNTNSSYVSIDLEDLSRLGLKVKSIEIENDGKIKRFAVNYRVCIFINLSFILS